MFDELVDRTIVAVEAAPIRLPELPGVCRPGALLAGAAGIALFLYEVGRQRGRAELGACARRWLELARTDDMVGPGFISGATGIEFVATVAALCDQRPDEVLASARTIDAIAGTAMSTDLYEGAAGVACAARELLHRLPNTAEHAEANEILVRVRDRMIERVLAKHANPLEPAQTDPLGMAHGVAGELWTLVVTLGAKHAMVYQRLDELAALRVADADDLVYWPPSLGTEPEQGNFGSFCNGMAGHTMLWCEVARQLRDDDTLELARAAATTTAALDSSNCSLCCGLTGQAIALRKYGELVDDAHFTELSVARLQQAVVDIATEMELPLWWGATGISLAALSPSRVPCFES